MLRGGDGDGKLMMAINDNDDNVGVVVVVKLVDMVILMLAESTLFYWRALGKTMTAASN